VISGSLGVDSDVGGSQDRGSHAAAIHAATQVGMRVNVSEQGSFREARWKRTDLLRRLSPQVPGTVLLAGLLLLLFLLVGCGGGEGEAGGSVTPAPAEGTPAVRATTTPQKATPAAPEVDLALGEDDITIGPLPLRAGVPFTVTAVIHNNSEILASDVPILVYISTLQEEISYTPFWQVLTETVPPSQSLEIAVPVNWNFPGGEHQLWVQVNRLPVAWQERIPILPEADTSDNIVLQDLVIDPFDAYSSDLCSGRTDVEIGPADVLPEPGQQRVLVRVHNIGNRAVYNLPIVVMGDQLSGIAYTPAIPPCGGTAEVYVEVDRPFQQGESLTVLLNPVEWADRLEEDEFENNRVSVVAGLGPDVQLAPGGGLDDYDFSISSADIEIPQMWILLVTVHNRGTRDAAMVPFQVENEAGRKLTDAIPLVQGNGLGVAAFPAGYLWQRGGTLTFTLNPEGAKGSYPERNRDNNVTTFTLP